MAVMKVSKNQRLPTGLRKPPEVRTGVFGAGEVPEGEPWATGVLATPLEFLEGVGLV